MPYGKSYQLTRRQFPLRLAYAITYNKSQSQTLSKVLLDITSPSFSHSQLYVALSRLQDYNNIRFYVTEDRLMQSNISCTGFMPNVDNIVYEDVLALKWCQQWKSWEHLSHCPFSLEDHIYCYALLSLKHYLIYYVINVFQVNTTKVIQTWYLTQVFRLVQSKNKPKPYYKHASTITIHFMLDTNASIYNQTVMIPF